MTATSRRGGPGGDLETFLLAVVAGLLIGTIVVVNAALRLSSDAELPGGFTGWCGLPVAVLQGQVPWTPAATEYAVTIGIVLAALAGGCAVWAARRRGRRHRIDRAAPYMARGRELAPLTRRAAAKTAARLGVEGSVGLPLGRTVAGGTPLLLPYEWTYLNIAGPRTGKTAGTVVPCALEAPGALIVTSNRRDVVDLLREPRLMLGEVLVFDPQQIIGEDPRWYWDPLSYVLSGPEAPEVKADRLASIFSIASVPPGSRGDRFFDPKGLNLLGYCNLAAAVDGRPITDIHDWVTDETDTTPVDILDRHRYHRQAKALRAIINSPDKQRGGIYATAELYVSFLTNSAAAQWITDTGGRRRREFSPDEFVRHADTLFIVSREGRGSMAPLTTALTAAVCEAAEALAARSANGRLPVPMTVLGDEMANVARWDQLPALFSHYGGRGIILMVFLQSWAQGVNVWGQHGMQAMMDAANVFVYGGSVRDTGFLDRLVKLVDKFRYQKVSSTTTKGVRSTGRTEVDEDIVSVGDLSALPPGKAMVFATGMRPTLINLVYWFKGPRRAEVEASKAKHNPTGEGDDDQLPAPREPDVPTPSDLAAQWTTP